MTDRLEQLKKLYAADPNDAFCTYGIALELAKTGQHDEALDWLKKTLEIDADYFYAYYQQGRILSESGNDDAAIEALNTGIAAAKGKDDHAAGEMQELLMSIDY